MVRSLVTHDPRAFRGHNPCFNDPSRGSLDAGYNPGHELLERVWRSGSDIVKRMKMVMRRSDDLQERRGGHHGAGIGAGVGRCSHQSRIEWLEASGGCGLTGGGGVAC